MNDITSAVGDTAATNKFISTREAISQAMVGQEFTLESLAQTLAGLYPEFSYEKALGMVQRLESAVQRGKEQFDEINGQSAEAQKAVLFSSLDEIVNAVPTAAQKDMLIQMYCRMLEQNGAAVDNQLKTYLESLTIQALKQDIAFLAQQQGYLQAEQYLEQAKGLADAAGNTISSDFTLREQTMLSAVSFAVANHISADDLKLEQVGRANGVAEGSFVLTAKIFLAEAIPVAVEAAAAMGAVFALVQIYAVAASIPVIGPALVALHKTNPKIFTVGVVSLISGGFTKIESVLEAIRAGTSNVMHALLFGKAAAGRGYRAAATHTEVVLENAADAGTTASYSVRTDDVFAPVEIKSSVERKNDEVVF